MDKLLSECTECVTMLSGRRIYMVVRTWAHSDHSGEIGTVYFDRELALRMRDPGEVVMELKLADSAATNNGRASE